MLAVAIEDLEMRCGNLNLLLRKSVIWFEPLAQKRKTSKQAASVLCYKY